jgi:hypothetical protein
MLAEIYMLRLEAAARAAKETARFIPITLPVVKALQKAFARRISAVGFWLGPALPTVRGLQPSRLAPAC